MDKDDAEYYSTADSGLVVYFRFDGLEDLGIGDDGQVDDIRDLSVNGNHGDLKGNAMLVLSDAPVKVKEYMTEIPGEFSLSQNYPNPFNPSTTIQFTVAKPSHVKLKLFDIAGRQVATLVDEVFMPGTYTTVFEAKDLASGIYFYRLEAGGFVETRKFTLLK